MRVLPCCIVGGALTGAISMAIGAKLMAPHGGLFVLLIPGAITPVLGYPGSHYCRYAGGGSAYAFLKRPEVDAVAKSSVIKGVFGQKFPALEHLMPQRE